MFLTTLSTAALFIFAIAAVFLVLQKIRSDHSIPAEILSQNCPADRYRPMYRLLDESDCAVIRAASPGNSGMLREFRAGRRALFRSYLRDLAADHARIVGAIRNMLIDSHLDRASLAKELFRCQLMFAMAMLSVEARLVLHTAGIGTVDARSLVGAVERLHSQLQDMVFVQKVAFAGTAA